MGQDLTTDERIKLAERAVLRAARSLKVTDFGGISRETLAFCDAMGEWQAAREARAAELELAEVRRDMARSVLEDE